MDNDHISMLNSGKITNGTDAMTPLQGHGETEGNVCVP